MRTKPEEDAIDIDELADHPAVARARAIVRDGAAETLADQLEVARIPAPPFGEAARASWIERRFRALGLEPRGPDEVGNVLARLPGPRAADGNDTAPIVVAAHMDTIFSSDTEIHIRRVDDRWVGPGVADNARGLGVLLGIARAIVGAELRTRRPIVLAGTVGEEGIGDLRGVKHMFRRDSPWRRPRAFIALEGAGRYRIVDRAVGSHRYRVTAVGPGGHSWADWGRVNPLHALGRAVGGLTRLPIPHREQSSLSVGRMAGGTGVNTIPSRAWLELDLRSEDGGALETLDRRVREVLDRVRDEANRERTPGTPALELDVEEIGRRPCGATARDAFIVRAAEAATRRIGERPERVASSTDANVPIALGIPSIALGGGGEAGEIHTTDEWYSDEGGAAGAERVLLALLAVAGVAGG